jgi:hypothetical protein
MNAGHSRCCTAHRVLIESLEGQIAHHRAQAQQYREAITTLESERSANAALTAEVEKLKATRERDEALLRQALEALESVQDHRPNDETNSAIRTLRAALAEPVLIPAPGYCKHCKQYTIEEPLPAEPVQEPVAHKHEWFSTGAMEPGQMRCIHCGKWGHEVDNSPPHCPNCASLEAQNTELNDMLVAMEHAVAQVAAAEREACADICDQHASIEGIAQRCAAEIRARGQA